MIRFGVVLSVVLVAIGLLVTGVVAGSLLLVAISIGVAVLAFLLLIGVVISFRHEIFGRGVPDGAVLASPVPASPVLPRAVPQQEAAEGVAFSGTAADTRGGVAAAATAGTLRQASDDQGRARPAAAAAAAAPSAGAPGTRGMPAAPGTAATPGTRVKAGDGKKADTGRRDGGQGDGRQKATGVRTKEPGAEPVTQEPRRAETPAAVMAGQDKPAGEAAPGTAAANAASTARSDRSGTAAAGAASTARSDRSGKNRPGSVPAEHQDRAEPHRASRLERESARAAVAKAPAAATAGSPPDVGLAGAQPAAKTRGARDYDQRQQEEPAAGAPAGIITKPELAAAAATGPGGDQKPSKPAEPDRDTASSAAGPMAGEPSASADSAQVTVVPGITRYHRSDCLLIRFLSADDLEVMTRRAATESGCVPCKACKPDLRTADLPVG